MLGTSARPLCGQGSVDDGNGLDATAKIGKRGPRNGAWCVQPGAQGWVIKQQLLCLQVQAAHPARPGNAAAPGARAAHHARTVSLGCGGEDPGEGIVAQMGIMARALVGQLARSYTHLIGKAVLDVHYPGMHLGLEVGGSQGARPVTKAH